MHRLLFTKTGDAVWMSHLDLMRLFQRAFKRAGLPLTHTKGFNPRPSVSIALPLSVGVESICELLDFELEGVNIPCPEITERLASALVPGVQVLRCYEDGKKLKELAFLRCRIALEYDMGVPENAKERLISLFAAPVLTVEKTGKNGIVEQDIIPMIKRLEILEQDTNTLVLDTVICCQNPSLNPAQLVAAIRRYAPELAPDFFRCRRMELFDTKEAIFR